METTPQSPHSQSQTERPDEPWDEGINWAEIRRKLYSGFATTLGLFLIGMPLAGVIGYLALRSKPIENSIQVSFAYSGSESGEYPDGSKFMADDLRAADIAATAIQKVLPTATSSVRAQIQNALSAAPVIPEPIQKNREKAMVAGQNPGHYIPSDYVLTLSLPADFPVSIRQRELILTYVVDAYREKFRRTFIDSPKEFGNAFESLENEDYFQYELILNQEMENIIAFLRETLAKARAFRSQNTNLSFSDLLKQAQIFRQVKLNQVLGYIYITGVTENFENALIKLDYHISVLSDESRRMEQQEALIQSMLAQAQERGRNYLVGRQNAAVAATPVVDENLLNQLIATDAYNLLVRRALEIGSRARDVSAELAQMTERRKRIQEIASSGRTRDKLEAKKFISDALSSLKADYHTFIERLRQTHHDYTTQLLSDAVYISRNPETPKQLRQILKLALLGGLAGLSLGAGLSLIDLRNARQRHLK